MNNVVKEIPVLIPKDIEEQKAISKVCIELDSQVKTLQTKKKKYQKIKL
jgi:restriction endonuclease S subunit